MVSTERVPNHPASSVRLVASAKPTIQTTGGKIFAGLYALYSGLVFLVAAGILLAPLFHRVMHRFHLGEQERARRRAQGGR